MDLNDLRVFEKVAALRNFSAAGRALAMPKSTVSRCVARLETELGIRLVQRTTHNVQLTEAGIAMQERCVKLLAGVHEAVDYVTSFSARPKGTLKVSAGIGFSYIVLSKLLPSFLERYPDVDITLDLSSRVVDLVPEGIDVAIRMGHMEDSQLIATRLGRIERYLCVSPSYLARHPAIEHIEDVRNMATVELPGLNGKPRFWTFTKAGNEPLRLPLNPRLHVNDPALIHRLVVNGAGIACLSGHLCIPDFEAGRLVHLFPDWKVPSVDMSIVFPSSRELSPTVRAFVAHIKDAAECGTLFARNLEDAP
ncbi:LysR family transcriptional regulator [Massilia sp. CMS3.1]|uniref:LysR family transcriptional regulator n=1 Tax=Massilia sp. CMS3.1 TaxID=3373083 RepID=UPI003EE5439B